MIIKTSDFMKGSACVSFLCINIISFLIGGLGIIGLPRSIILMGMCYIPLAYVLLKTPKLFPQDVILLGGFVGGLFIVSSVLHPELSTLIKEGLSNSIFSLYGILAAYLFFRTVNDKRVIRKILLLSAAIFFIYYSYEAMISLSRGYWEEVGFGGMMQQQSYSMSFGYNMLFPTIVFLAYGIKEKNKCYAILGLVGLVEVLLGGSRASLLSAIVFIALYWIVFYYEELSFKQKILSVLLLIITIGAVTFFYVPILNGITQVLNTLGIESRNIEKLLTASITDDTNRAILYEKSRLLVSSGGLFGHGIFADRFILGNYCHNIIYELFIDFGYVGGTLAIFYLGIVVFRSLFRFRDQEWKLIFLIMFSCCFTRLLVSYSFWLDVKFWIAYAIYMNMRGEARKVEA